jgi:predicted ATP-dependent endonuclease of OLD family
LKLVNFSVTNFRSITTAHKIPISETTILIGRNNEGKSNILKALSVVMNALQEHFFIEKRGRTVRRPTYMYRKDEKQYYWERDFPIALQERKSQRQSIFRLEFELNPDEIKQFREDIKSNLNGTLPLVIRIGEDNKPKVKVIKKGRGSKTLNLKSGKIAHFIARKVHFNHIPAIRTDQEAMSVISDMLSHELRVLEKDESYQEAMKVINQLQKAVLKDLALRLKKPLSEFLPNIKGVDIEISGLNKRVPYRKDFNVIIDDGTPTSIEFKGDGVKSLAALGLLKNKQIEEGISIIAIEEPESHLHPSAIHYLNEIIQSLSAENQVIITTHNPLFVDRTKIKSNIIINNGNASTARNVKQIRDLLGIKASDNLLNANYALIVEGESDKKALTAILPMLNGNIGKALKSNLLVIEPIRGAGNLSYKLSQLKNSLCVCHTLLDNDEAAKTAYDKAKKDGLISLKDCTFVNCQGMPKSEFEDCINVSTYSEKIKLEYGVDLSSPKFKSNQKWSNRMKNVFNHQGKQWDEDIEKEIKTIVAESIALNPTTALNSHKSNSIDSLVNNLESIIKS